MRLGSDQDGEGAALAPSLAWSGRRSTALTRADHPHSAKGTWDLLRHKAQCTKGGTGGSEKGGRNERPVGTVAQSSRVGESVKRDTATRHCSQNATLPADFASAWRIFDPVLA
jgi:hypothetical protein